MLICCPSTDMLVAPAFNRLSSFAISAEWSAMPHIINHPHELVKVVPVVVNAAGIKMPRRSGVVYYFSEIA